MTSKSKLILTGVALLVGAGGAAALAVAHAHSSGGHAHGHEHHAPAGSGLATDQLQLNGAEKWQTDAPLREGMTGIRSGLEAAIPRIHASEFTPADYEKLAGSLEARLNGIIANCKLPPEADAQLHLVVADVFAGASAMKTEGDRSAGAVKVSRALDAYGRFFDQPGWTPIVH